VSGAGTERCRGAGKPASRGFALLGLLLALAGGARAQGAPPEAAPMLPFLVQSICLDGGGRPMPGVLPFEPACQRRAPAQPGALPYRRHDWPVAAVAARDPLGYQASDSLLTRYHGRPAVVHALDFGQGDRRFGVLDRGRGDGGNLMFLGEAAVFAAMTEDATGGVQWFRSPDCRQGGSGMHGWLLFVWPATAQWQSQLVQLSIAPSPEICPPAFGPSYTRWRLARFPLPWREAATGAVGELPAEAIVSEHYAGTSIQAAHHLERFLLVRDLGLVRWERWENLALSRIAGAAQQAERVEAQNRCPELPMTGAPGPGWVRTACRFWTNFVRATPGGPPLRALDWP